MTRTVAWMALLFAALLTLGYCSRDAVSQEVPPPHNPLVPPSWAPGALNPDVTQDNIHQTICVSGYTMRVRPKASYTTRLKVQQLKTLGYADQNPRDYEEDHLISLEIGGNPVSPANLWPEPYAGRCGARVKDRIEDKLHVLVCGGQITLAEAQKAISSNWINAYNTYIGTLTCQ